MTAAVCPGWNRHWFSIHGTTRLRSPLCVRCFIPNPRPLTEEDWSQLIGYRDVRGFPYNARIEAEIRAWQEGQR